jgi:hypothetical protein
MHLMSKRDGVSLFLTAAMIVTLLSVSSGEGGSDVS